jgi:O-antigen/teichoic acid export membrane protein
MPRMMDEMNAGVPVDKTVSDMRDAFLFVMWPALAGLAVLSEPITLLLYGDQWEIAGHVLLVLCLAEAFRVARSGAMEVLLFRDKLKLNNQIEAVFLFTNVVLFLVALPFGFMAVIWSRAIETAFEFMLYGWILHRSERIPLIRYTRNYLIHGGLALAAVLPALALMIAKGWPQRLPFGEMLLVVAAGIAMWVATALAIRHPAAEVAKRALTNLRARSL